ncbi:MAG TPA: PPC domain-containing protein [Planctomycetaceae bacterium]|nr:PPC domain-containing protein [Planctomycetaceae bacterium]
MSFRFLVLATTALISAEATAAPPDVKTLFPAGGQRGQTVEVTVGGKLNARPASAWASRPGVTVEVPDEGEKVRVTIADDAPPGVCWLRFHNAEGASALRPFVIGTLPETNESEPNDEYAEPQTLPEPSVVVNGRLEKSGDVDTFAVSLSKGQTLVAALDANQTLGSPMDGVLQVVSTRGFVLAQNDDGPDLDPLLVFTPEADGTYLVRLFAFPAETNSSIRLAGGGDYIYRLTVTTGPFVDHVAPLAVTRGAETAVEQIGWNIADDQRRLGFATDEPVHSVESPHPVRRAGVTDVRIVPHATALEQDSASAGQPQPIELPVAVTGHIGQTGESDVYAFTATKGEKRSFRVEARSLGSPLDPVLELKDAAGKTLRRVDDARRNAFDPELEFTFDADGAYRLHVSDAFGHGGFRYVYLLTAAAPHPDYTLAVKADTFKLTPGKPLEIPVTVARTNGFDREIEISVEGLPEGVLAVSAKSPAKGDGSKAVKLELKADGAGEGDESVDVTPVSGPIRIVGRVADQSDFERVAEAPIAGLQRTTADLWLTVIAADGEKR